MKGLSKNKYGVSYPIQSISAFFIVFMIISFYFAGMNSNFVHYQSSDVDVSAKAIDIAERLVSDAGQTNYLVTDWEKDPENVSVLGLAAESSVQLTEKENYFARGSNYGNSKLKDYITNIREIESGRIVERVVRIALIEIEPPVSSDREPVYVYIYFIMPDSSVNFPDDILSYDIAIEIYNDENKFIYELKDENSFAYTTLDERKIENLSKLDYNQAKESLGLDSRYDFSIEIIAKNGSVILKYPKSMSFDGKEVVSTHTRNVLIRHPIIVPSPLGTGKKGPTYCFIGYTYSLAKMTVKVFC